HKSIWVDERSYWAQMEPPPATEPVDVIVPVLGRTHTVETFMRSLRASTGLATVYVVADADDPCVSTWVKLGAKVIKTEKVTFAEKVNYALASKKLKSSWVFVTGDDVRFHSGWLDHAQWCARDVYDVVGTNDMASPRVTEGTHAVHVLVRRSYIDDV